jgi:hypothetical protein
MDNDIQVAFCPGWTDMNQGRMLSGGPAGCVPNINESPTFPAFVKATTACLISSGVGTPGSVGNGTVFGGGFVLGDAGLGDTPVELWSAGDLRDRFHLAEVALFESNAERLNLRLEVPSAFVRDRVVAMIPRFIGAEWAPRGAGEDLTAELDGEADAETVKKLATVGKLLAKAKEALKEEGGGDEPAEIVASLQLRHDALAACASPRTPGRRAQGTPTQPPHTVGRRPGDTPPTPRTATPRSLADQAAMQAAQRRGAGAMYLLHSEFPKTCQRQTGGQPPAPIEGMSAAAVADVLFYLDGQRELRNLVRQSLAA